MQSMAKADPSLTKADVKSVREEAYQYGLQAEYDLLETSLPEKAPSSGEALQAMGYLGESKTRNAPSPGSSGGLQSVEVAGNIRIRGAYFETSPDAPVGGSVGKNPYDDASKNYWPGHNTEAYGRIVENPFLAVTQNPLSTFSIDVDTASYSNLRRFLNQGQLPPPDAVRIEELLNYFPYHYAPPADQETPFAAHVALADCPWKPEHRLARVAIKGWEIPAYERPVSNLVFLVDVSGSMQPENKLPLVKKALRMLTEQLDERDRVSMAVYANASGLVLPPTPGNQKETILTAIERLQSGGSTHGSAGIQLAYETAVSGFLPGGVNRVILCTDGDFNVGVTNQGDLTRLIEEKAKSGIFLSVLGFGMGNLKDSTMELLADKGNGNYAYIDTENEARKVLVDQMQGTLVTIAKDVKIQVEFNPAAVSAYRLIGYENRMLRAEDFNDDKKDAGEIGAGHAVTALYEIVPAGQAAPAPAIDALKYQSAPPAAPVTTAFSGEVFTLKIRYKKPDGDTSAKLEFPIRDAGLKYAQADADFKFAAAVAEFGMLLRHSQHAGQANFGAILELAEEGRGSDPHGYRSEFINLVRMAASMASR
jgi:Ca-activated chloride channel family protein